MANSSGQRRWLVEFLYGGEENEMREPLRHEGYQKPFGREVGIINLTCSGKMCVYKDDPLCRCYFTVNPQDPSGEQSYSL